MIEIKTLKQSLRVSEIPESDRVLAGYLNEGWEILSLNVYPESDEEYEHRFVTLKRDTAPLLADTPAPAAAVVSLPADLIAAYIAALNETSAQKGFFAIMAVLSHHIPESEVYHD